MKTFKLALQSLLLALVVWSCSHPVESSLDVLSSGADETSTLPAIAASLSVEVTGLAGALILSDGSGTNVTITSDGMWSIPGAYFVGDDYSLELVECPPHQTSNLMGDTISGSLQSDNTIIQIGMTHKEQVQPLAGKRIFLSPSSSTIMVTGAGSTIAANANRYATLLQDQLEKMAVAIKKEAGSFSGSLNAVATSANEWQADLILGIGFNSGGGHGTETYYQAGASASDSLAGIVHQQVVASAAFANRGVKTQATLYDVAEAPAIFCSICFADCTDTHTTPYGSISESQAILNSAFTDNIVLAFRDAIFDYFNLTQGFYPPDAPQAFSCSMNGSVVNLEWTRAADEASQDADNSYFLMYVQKNGEVYGASPWSTKECSYQFAELPAGSYRFELATYHAISGECLERCSADIIIQ